MNIESINVLSRKGERYFIYTIDGRELKLTHKINMNIWEKINEMSKGAEDGWGGGYYHVIPKLINENNYKIGAEIGVAYGGHSESILKNTKIEKLYSIDPYQPDWFGTDGYSMNGKNFGFPEYEELYLHALHRLRKYGNRSVFIRDTGHAAWSQVHELLDFVFIDAKHTYNDLYADMNQWIKSVRIGGMISGHDYGHESYPGIKLAVDRMFGEENVNTGDGFVWWVKL
jgi:hypothetical protein